MTTPPAPPADQFVTSSDLVRHFGLWQERAARAPLYILHRGRPRYVLASIETMDALCAPHAPHMDAETRQVDPAALLDGVRDLVVVADAAGAITASSRSARAHFGPLAAPGAAVVGLSAPSTRAVAADAIRRVIASGTGERLEIPSAAREGRMLDLAVEPARAGVALFAQDGTTARDHARVIAGAAAFDAALCVATGAAAAVVNLRGYVADPSPSLAALTRLAPAALSSIRFVTLVEIGARAALGEAIERALAGETPPPVAATLLVNRADPLSVRIGLAPIRGGAGIEGAAAVILAA